MTMTGTIRDSKPTGNLIPPPLAQRIHRIILLLGLTFLLAGTVNAEQVNLYSNRQESLIKPLIEIFQQRTGITVNNLFLGSGMFTRIQQERGFNSADLVISTDLLQILEAKAAGLLQPVKLNNLSGKIDSRLYDRAGFWYGLSQRARLIYLTKRIDPATVTDYLDLASPKFQGRVCLRSGFHNYNVTLFAAIRHHLGAERLRAFLSAVKNNLAYLPQGNDRFQVKSIWQGNCDIALGNSYYYGLMQADPEQQEWAASVNPIFPTLAGEFGTHVNISAAAVLADSKNVPAAKKLLEFLLTPEAQAIYANKIYEYPVRSDVAVDPAVTSWGEIKPDQAELTDIVQHYRSTLQMLTEVDFDN